MKLSPPHGLSQSHICSPKGLCPNDYHPGWGKGGGVKTPGEKPFALEMWGCVIISTAAIRSRTETAGSRPARLQAQNICRVGNKMCRGPSLSRHRASLPRHSPLSPKRGGRQNHRSGRGAAPRLCTAKTQRRHASSSERSLAANGNRGRMHLQTVRPTRTAASPARAW